jgi:hypothetical protein
MLRNVNTTQSECSRESGKQRMFSAVRALDGGLSALDRSVLCSVVEWLQLQRREHQATDDRWTGLSLMPARRCMPSTRWFIREADAERARFRAVRAVFCSALGCPRRRPPRHAALLSMHALAASFANTLHCHRGMPLAEECGATRSQVLGEMHPDTLQSMSTVARICFQQKQFRSTGRCCASAMYELCAAKRRVVLGDSHPKTLVTMANLAVVCQQTDELSCALDLYSECCLHSRAVNGNQHPDTLTFISCLASSHRALAQHERALDLFEEWYAAWPVQSCWTGARKQHCHVVQHGQSPC